MKAVKSNSDPEWGAYPSKEGVVPPGFVLTAFLFSTPSRTPHDSKAPAWVARKETQGCDFTPQITLPAC